MSSGAEQLTILGRTFAEQGQHDKAISYFEQALERYREAQDMRGEALTLFDLGVSHQILRHQDRAFILFDKALYLFVELRDDPHIADTCFYLAQYMHNFGNTERAVFYMQTAHDVYEKLGRSTIESRYFLDAWQGREDSTFDRRRAFLAQLLRLYEEQGEFIFTESMRRNGMPDDEIEALIIQLRNLR